MNSNIFPEKERSYPVFGQGALAYGPLINKIYPYFDKDSYYFEDIDVYLEKIKNPVDGRNYLGKIYWKEILYRAHMASIVAILRNTRWVSAVTTEFENRNLFGWAAACRSLIEAAGDTMDGFGAVGITLAEKHRIIQTEISGAGSGAVHASSELENLLIHFTHARKIPRKSDAPESHRAKEPYKYVKHLENMKIIGVAEFYQELCEIVHPASKSISTMLSVSDEGVYSVDVDAESRALSDKVKTNQTLMSDLLMAAYNGPLITLSTLHKFNLFTKIDPLRGTLDNIPQWQEVNAALRT